MSNDPSPINNFSKPKSLSEEAKLRSDKQTNKKLERIFLHYDEQLKFLSNLYLKIDLPKKSDWHSWHKKREDEVRGDKK